MITSFKDYHCVISWLTNIGQGYLVPSYQTSCVIHMNPRQPQLSFQVWNLLRNILIFSSSRKRLSIVPLGFRANLYGWRSSTSDFSFTYEIKITFRRYVSFTFSWSHNGKGKKRLKEVLCKHKERKSSLPSQRNPLCCKLAHFL